MYLNIINVGYFQQVMRFLILTATLKVLTSRCLAKHHILWNIEACLL
jgi:hypothetical protein